jgi:hypothetical protein
VAAAAGAVVATVLAGGVAWAAIPGDGGVYSACMLRNVGTVRLIDKSLPAGNLMSHCKPALESEVTWSRQGPPGSDGDDGRSPTVAQLALGDANCPGGGAAITDATGSTAYVCSGRDGADGASFAGTFTSPSGEYSIAVTDAGITIGHGTSGSIALVGDDLTVRSRDLDIESARNVTWPVGGAMVLDSAGNLTLETDGAGLLRAHGRLDLQGSVVQIN